MAPKGRKGRGKGKQIPRKTNATGSGPNPAAGRNFPSDVIFGILTRLPVKSLLRFTCVSRQWRTVVSLQSFISQHLARSPASLLIHALQPPVPVAGEDQPEEQPDADAVFSYGPPDPKSGKQISTVERIPDFPEPENVSYNELNIVGSAPNGVVCIVQEPYAYKFTLWNPATRSSLRIPASGTRRPDPFSILSASGGLAFDPTRNEYILIRTVCFIQDHAATVPDVAEVFNFQTGLWGRLDNDVDGMLVFRSVKETCDAVVNGVPYWRGWVHDPVMGPKLKLAWFDVTKSDFNEEWFGWEADDREMILGEIQEGYLGAIVWDEPESGDPRTLEVWMRESRNGAWAQRYRVDNLPVVGRLIGFYALDGSSGIVQEIVDTENEDGPPFLCNINLDTMAVEDYICLGDSWPGTCYPMVRYRESLTRMPRVGRALI